jgi:hypothetical protein
VTKSPMVSRGLGTGAAEGARDVAPGCDGLTERLLPGAAVKRGPREVARDALAILESMRGGEPVDEEIADVLTDACWEAYGNGLENGKASKRTSRTNAVQPAGVTPNAEDAPAAEAKGNQMNPPPPPEPPRGR